MSGAKVVRGGPSRNHRKYPAADAYYAGASAPTLLVFAMRGASRCMTWRAQCAQSLAWIHTERSISFPIVGRKGKDGWL